MGMVLGEMACSIIEIRLGYIVLGFDCILPCIITVSRRVRLQYVSAEGCKLESIMGKC